VHAVSNDTAETTPIDPLQGICDDLQAETAELVRILVPLPAALWDQETPAAGWTIRDQVGHLAFFDETGTLAATDEVAFRASAAELMKAKDPGVAGLDRARALKPAELLSWFMNVRGSMIATFRTLDGRARLPWYGPSMAATSFATARLMETWAHGQDIADTVGADRTPSERLKHIAHIGVRARPFSYATNGRDVPEGAVRVTLTSPSGATWSWNEEAGDANSVTGDALDFCLMVTQRRHVRDTNLVVTGPLAEDWVGIAQAFAGGPGSGRAPGQFAPA
jgi:uncharacterized protein (TIGR03084 family)